MCERDTESLSYITNIFFSGLIVKKVTFTKEAILYFKVAFKMGAYILQ